MHYLANRKEPESRPQTLSLRKLRTHLSVAVLEAEAVVRAYQARGVIHFAVLVTR